MLRQNGGVNLSENFEHLAGEDAIASFVTTSDSTRILIDFEQMNDTIS